MRFKTIIFIFTALLLSPVLISTSYAQTDGVILKAQQPWETYGVGSTCISGSSNLFVADIDADGVIEIITGGSMYQIINGSRGIGQAPLMIWNWNGNNITLELSYKWPGSLRGVYAADLNGDSIVELITAGTYRNETGSYNTVRIWHWNNKELSLKAHYEGIAVSSIQVSDLNKDGTPELLTVGRLTKDDKTTAQLTLWHYSNNLELIKTLELDSADVTNANSVYASDLDNNGDIEIAIAGYSDNLNNSKGQVTVWHWNGNVFTLKANKEWQLGGEGYALTIAGGVQGNTIANNIKAADINQDGVNELVVGGFTWDGQKVKAQIKIFAWDGTNLTEKDSQEWTSDYLTEVKCLSLYDVDGDGKTDVISSGTVAAAGSFKNDSSPPDRGQLRIWDWNGEALTLKENKEWTLEDGACAWNVVAIDIDKEGDPEIVTVGCIGIDNLCDPNMRIWEAPQTSNNSSYMIFLFVGVAIAAFAISILFFVHRGRSRKANKAAT
jgi:hypothetical protein